MTLLTADEVAMAVSRGFEDMGASTRGEGEVQRSDASPASSAPT
jgi:hypothetical protein